MKKKNIIITVILVISIIFGCMPVSAAEVEAKFEYVMLDETSISLVSCVTNSKDVVIPAEYDGYTVRKLKSTLFAKNTYIESVCIPKSVEEIERGIFEKLASLKNITVDKGNNVYSSKDGVLLNSKKDIILFYPKGKSDKTFIVEENIKKIEKGAIVDNSYIEQVKFTGNIKIDIGKGNFKNLLNLKEVNYPITDAKYPIFIDCPKLECVMVPEYISVMNEFDFDGALYVVMEVAPNSYAYKWAAVHKVSFRYIIEEVPTEKVTEKTTEVATEAPTEKVTEKVTEVATEAPTEDVTEKYTEVTTEVPTEKITEKVTEVATEAPTEDVTEKYTEVTTEVPTEKITEKVTEVATEAPTEDVTEKYTEVTTEVPTEEVTEKETEVATQVPTEEVTEKETEVATEVPTEKVTEKTTEVATEAPTEKITEKVTEVATQVPTEEVTQTTTEIPTENNTEKETEMVTETPTQKNTNRKDDSTTNNTTTTVKQTIIKYIGDDNKNKVSKVQTGERSDRYIFLMLSLLLSTTVIILMIRKKSSQTNSLNPNIRTKYEY